CIRVGGGVHSDRLDAELLAGPQDAKRNFTAVGDQDFLKHRPAYSMTTSGSPYSTGCASWHRIAVTVPARGAGIWFIVFIASMMRRVWPSFTCWPTVMNGAAPGAGAR